MIKLNRFLSPVFGVAMAAAFCAIQGAASSASAPQSAWRPPTSVDKIPFVNGTVVVPKSSRSPNNRGVLTDTTLPGMTHIETVLDWPLMEPAREVWNDIEFDEIISLATERGLKILMFPAITTPPKWMEQPPIYVPFVNELTGEEFDAMSLWAPGTYEAYDHFYSYMGSHYQKQVDIVKMPMEIGVVQGDEAGHFMNDRIFWCGDKFARADFLDRMLAKYGSLGRLNAAWNTHWSAPSEITYPDEANRATQERRWVDFLTWYRDSETRAMVKQLRIIRKHFPTQLISIPMGFGSDVAIDGCDRTGAIKAAADFKPVCIRSTHSGFNRNKVPQAYWFYKRMAPTCHRLGVGFGTEPPGGDFTYSEMRRELFDAASAGPSFIMHYYQNFHLAPVAGQIPHIIDDYKRVLRPFENSLDSIGILYPTSQMMLDVDKGFPDYQLDFCAQARPHVTVHAFESFA